LCLRARATIASGEPPLDLLTYQIHMPLESKGVVGAAAAGAAETAATAAASVKVARMSRRVLIRVFFAGAYEVS
jgi:hypothetical protein